MTVEERRAQLAVARTKIKHRNHGGRPRCKLADAISVVTKAGSVKFVFRTPGEAERLSQRLAGGLWDRDVGMKLHGNVITFWKGRGKHDRT